FVSASTINHNKSMVEEVTFLKKDFKQKENKYPEDFLDMKSLKEKVEDRLIKQDQSLHTVHMLCRPKPHYNELNKVAIGYKNPLCLTRAKQVQPALYSGHEIIKDNHTPAEVHNTEDTLEIAKITRKKMNDKMNDPECVTRKVKIASHDYSKENFLATFKPQKQLTPGQFFWSNDLIKLKSEALYEQTKVSRPIKALTVYPPNTPTMLVPKVLPTKSQVKIHIFRLIQLFSDFDKTCKKRITPTGLTEGERGFEQTKECYLKDVIPFFKTLKDNFEGIQKALTKEIKEMKDVFEELEAEKTSPRKAPRTTPATITTTTTTLITDEQPKVLIAKGVVNVLAELDVTRSKNGEDSYDSGTGVKRNERATHETVGHDVAYAVTWTNLKKMMIDKYCPRGEIKKLEIEMWNLKVKGTDVCVRMFPEESDKIEKYVGGLPDMIHGSVMASKPKTMQDAIDFATELTDKKISTFAKRQADETSRNNQNQAQQLPKRQNVAQAYADGTSERKEYAGTLPLCNKCKFHHNGSYTAKCVNWHYKSDCPELKNQNHRNQAEGTEARGMVYALGGGETDQDPNNIEDGIEA
nr:hypothetical protein [Tanacetum cinerariifolium]